MVVSLSESVRFTLTNSVPKKIIDDAVRFHGHLGPFLILGVKAGLFANETLGKDYFKTRTIVETELAPPCSCFADGVQFVTGCTMGKGKIELRDGCALSVLFLKDDKKLKLSLKGEVLESLKRISSKKESEKMALNLSKKPIREIFDTCASVKG